MAPPFPGMDPFIESQVWEDFHLHYMSAMLEPLALQVRPRYVVRAERRIYVEHARGDPARHLRADVAVARTPEPAPSHDPAGPSSRADRGPSDDSIPVVLTLPMPEEKRESYLTIRHRDTLEVVAIIELLSPTNKRTGSDGQREYLEKREQVLTSATHLIELDLLRVGDRLPTVEPLPSGDYYAFVSRANRRPSVEVYAWTLRDPMTTIRVPLSEGDSDVELDLQDVFNTVYERVGYDYSLDYRAAVYPPLGESAARWVEEILKSTGKT